MLYVVSRGDPSEGQDHATRMAVDEGGRHLIGP